MSDQIPYADYVRIEIHAGGKAQIIELVPDERQKVKAELTFVVQPHEPIWVGADPVQRLSSYPHIVLELSGPTATCAFKDSDR